MKKSVWIVAAVLPLLLAGCGDEGAEDLGAVSGKAVTAAPTDLPTEMPSAPAPAPSLSAPPSPSAPTDPDDAENTEIKRVEAPDDIDCPKIVAADAAPLTGPATSGSEVQFGKAYSWPNQVTVSVSTPKAYNPTPQAAGVEGPGQVAMRMTVTVRNDSSTAYSMSTPYEVVNSGGVESSQIFDLGQCMEGSPSDSLAKGKQASYMIAWVIKDPKSIKLTFEPGNDLDPITFVN
ncbi:MAG TPA: hypothetical protein VIR30_09680 [Nocardioides sp.]